MPLTRLARLARPLLLTPVLASLAACDLLDQFEDGGGIVNFYSAHHPTAADGEFPARGTDHIELDTDTGWHVIISEAYVTTTAITLHRCDGDELEADFYWGALNESLNDPDLEVQGVGAVKGPEGNYCAATITYGPTEVEGEDESGDTVYLRGAAKQGDKSVPFEIRTRASRTVQLDLSTIENGSPLKLDHDQYVAEELTFAKTYDRFFDGLDFDELSSMDLEPIVLDTLEIETRVVLGTEIRP